MTALYVVGGMCWVYHAVVVARVSGLGALACACCAGVCFLQYLRTRAGVAS